MLEGGITIDEPLLKVVTEFCYRKEKERERKRENRVCYYE